jgi:hypothetical protein
MASTVSLDLDGKTFKVLKCLCKTEQQFDQTGSPASGVTGGSVSLLMEGSADDDFASWMCDKQPKDGTINFSIDGASFKKIEFKNGFLVKMHESFHAEGAPKHDRFDRLTEYDDISENYMYDQIIDYQDRSKMGYMMQCSISAEKVSIDGVDHDNLW